MDFCVVVRVMEAYILVGDFTLIGSITMFIWYVSKRAEAWAPLAPPRALCVAGWG